jgi:hypothetical protein
MSHQPTLIDAIRAALDDALDPEQHDTPYIIYRVGLLLQHELGVIYLGPHYQPRSIEGFETEDDDPPKPYG